MKHTKKWSILCTLDYAINYQFVLSQKGVTMIISQESTEKSPFSSTIDSLFRFSYLICMFPIIQTIQSVSSLVAVHFCRWILVYADVLVYNLLCDLFN